MSASTVSITANPAARRRPVLATEKKSTAIEFLSNDQLNGADPAINNVLTSDRLVASHSKDLSHHSIRGEAGLERTSKDLAHVKKTAFGNSIAPRRSRKVSSKNDKPLWQTVLNVVTKISVLLITLIGFVYMVRWAFMKSVDPMVGTQMALSESEARIAEVESLFKNSVKMIQVQVEVVNKKIGSEVGMLRKEMDKKLDDKIVFLESDLKQLAARSDRVEKSLGELKAVDWLSKEDFNKFLEEQKGAGLLGSDNDVSLDDIRTYAREIVLKEIEKHASDGLGRVDYALASGGGMVVKHSDPYLTGKLRNWFLTSTRGGVHPDADKMLKPSFGEPGQCFPLKGTTGFVQIRLRGAVIPEAVTLEHVAKGVAYDRSSAPKNCWVSGWLQGHDMDSAVDKQKMFLLTEFTYDLEKSNAQTFNVLDSATSTLVDTIRLDFTSNHGSSSHTCIYRLRVHGYKPESVSVMAMES
ncbi:SUN domain-containing protein 1 [Euphorbia lathyris]|uniref:SUN domain-containing protein 1 n=1 Tax=Euphorbia lathyris TaxID=212925 RepID=UPI0033130FE9